MPDSIVLFFLSLYALGTIFFAGGTFLDVPNYGYKRNSMAMLLNVALMVVMWPLLVLWFGIQKTFSTTARVWRRGQ